jgi:hypothetical protein
MRDSHVPTTALAAAPVLTATLTAAEWQARAVAHLERAQRWTRPFRERRSRGEVHPVYDFLFQYYHYSGGRLETWHPGPEESIEDSAEARERFTAPVYETAGGVIRRNASALAPAERDTLHRVLHLLRATRDRPPNFGCYGIHEWAMVYGGHDVRHAEIAPLRLPQAEVDAFVESRPVACSHFDAFRFFAPAAKPMNRVPLTWATRDDSVQPGCIHANMDLYRWAYTAMPWIGSDLLWLCFELAVALRVLDMQAGPYDLEARGFAAVRVETSAGRDEYQRRQRELSVSANALRTRLIDAVGGII